MSVEIKTSYISSKILTSSKLSKAPKLKGIKNKSDFKYNIKIELITNEIALIEAELVGKTTLFNVEKISDSIWDKMNFFHKKHIGTILLANNSENHSPSLLGEESIKKIQEGIVNPKTYAVIMILSSDINSNKGISYIQEEINIDDLKRKNIMYGYDLKRKALKNMQKIIKSLRKNKSLANKLSKSSNPAYFLVSKILKMRTEPSLPSF